MDGGRLTWLSVMSMKIWVLPFAKLLSILDLVHVTTVILGDGETLSYPSFLLKAATVRVVRKGETRQHGHVRMKGTLALCFKGTLTMHGSAKWRSNVSEHPKPRIEWQDHHYCHCSFQHWGPKKPKPDSNLPGVHGLCISADLALIHTDSKNFCKWVHLNPGHSLSHYDYHLLASCPDLA